MLFWSLRLSDFRPDNLQYKLTPGRFFYPLHGTMENSIFPKYSRTGLIPVALKPGLELGNQVGFALLMLLLMSNFPLFQLPAEMEPEAKEEEGEMTAEDEEEAKIPEEEQPRLENGENAEDNESGSADSGQENLGETRLLRSGTYSDRTESKAYGSVTHKCEVRLLMSPVRVPAPLGTRQVSPAASAPVSVPRTAGRSSPTLGTSSDTSVSTPERNPSPAGSVTKRSPTRLPAKPTRRHTGTAALGTQRCHRQP